jgi:hypothetical protein
LEEKLLMIQRSLLVVFVLLALAGVAVASAQSNLPGSGWTSGQQIQNVGDSQATIVFTAYGQNGVAFDCGSHVVPPGGAANFQSHIDCPFPGSFIGSAVVSSDQPMATIVNINNRGVGLAAGQYRGTDDTEISTTISFPLVKHNHFGRTTAFYVQNTAEVAANITYTIKMQSGQNVTKSINGVPAYAMAIITPADAGIPAGNGQVGGLTVQGTQPLAGAALEYQHSAAVGQNLQASKAFTPASYDSTVYCPLYRNDHTGRHLTTGAQVQNVSNVSQKVTLTFTPVGGGATRSASQNVAPGASATFYAPNLGIPPNTYGSVIITGEADIVAVVNDEGKDLGVQRTTTYTCFPASSATPKISLPLVKELFFGDTSGIQVQNVGGSPATITFTYIPWGGGGAVKFRNAVPTASGGAFTAWAVYRVPSEIVVISGNPADLLGKNTSVVVESNQPILAIVNESSEGSNPSKSDSKTYEGVNR